MKDIDTVTVKRRVASNTKCSRPTALDLSLDSVLDKVVTDLEKVMIQIYSMKNYIAVLYGRSFSGPVVAYLVKILSLS
jgi:bifunctional DNase/RNase